MSGQRSKRLGYTFEIDVRDYLKPLFAWAKRNGTQFGPKDRGDISGVPNWTLQCKNVSQDRWAEWFKSTIVQAVNNETRWWAVIRKARRKNVSQALFVMTLEKGRELMAYLCDLEEENRQLKERIKELISD